MSVDRGVGGASGRLDPRPLSYCWCCRIDDEGDGVCVCVCVCVCVEWGGRQVAWIQDYVDLLHCHRLHSVAAGIVRACAGNKIIFFILKLQKRAAGPSFAAGIVHACAGN